MSGTGFKFGIVGLVLLAYGTACCCCSLPVSEEDRERMRIEREAREAAAEVEAAAAMERGPDRFSAWRSLHTWLPRGSPNDRVACDDALLKSVLGDPLLRTDLMAVDAQALPGAAADSGPWSFLDSGDVDAFRNWEAHPNDAEGTRALWQASMGAAKNRFVVVLTGTDRALAAGFDEGGFMRSGGFETAYVEGGLVVADLDAKAVLCAAPVIAESSDSVEYDDEGIVQTTLEEAVQADFENNLEDAMNAALASISGEIAVNFVGLF